ncbi:hypothetical protein AGABI2DRAFT_65827 [Agaricus bisporus var. bisporus H97]|uniref:hypothetical protein n=1 Tax=Agaricus bisporus var. bisporus (strain H97 / ATCC MYA-4626 / FGSC 10389) TaxID=936046 RepID=UPI00029F7F73|nr:hypothetical protein AGABI2DRAFT_65827 [Agaricus bisporus var. bisporus H97]EKV49332.1 hypothetical protein AGABI2DRAFT_65827 [Agaricus bisporus var. bisporus H97]
MASCGNPDVEADASMTKRPKYDRNKTCVKCKLQTGNIVIRHAVYCKDCFFPLISLRFRRTLEPHINPNSQQHRRKGLKASRNLLIGLSGGLGSSVLLDVIQKTYLSPRERQQGDQNPNGITCPWSKIFVVYVDISGIMIGAPDESSLVEQFVKRHSTKMEYVRVKLEDAFDQARSPGLRKILLKVLSSSTCSPLVSLKTYIESLPTQTAISSAIQALIRVLLLHTAALTHSSHLLLGTSLTSLSISLISSISQGGGYSIREETQEEWTYRIQDDIEQTVRVIRPLCDVGMKECAFWAWWCGFKVVGKHRYSSGRQDIGALTRDFSMGLEKDYPSTVSTIARTCNKLTTKGDTSMKCLICQRPAQSGTQDWKQNISIRSYSDISPEDVPPGHVNLASRASDDLPPSNPHSIASSMCYACHTSWTSKSIRGRITKQTDIPLPVWLKISSSISEERRQITMESMRNTIDNFLLDPDS